MLSIAVTAVIVLTGSAQAGYYYPHSNTVFELPKNEPNFQEGFTHKTRQGNAAQQGHEAVVSYSVPYEDFHYLRQHKIDQQARPNLATNTRTVHTVGVPSTTVLDVKSLLTSPSVEHTLIGNTPVNNLHIDAPTVVQPLNFHAPTNQQINLALNSVQHTSSPAIIIPNVKSSTLRNQQNNSPVNAVRHFVDIPRVNVQSVNNPVRINQHNNLAGNTFPQINIPTNNKPTLNLPIQLNQRSNLELNQVKHIGIPSVNVASVNFPAIIDQESNLNTQQEIRNHAFNSDLDGSVTAQNVVSPKITKDIYFHVPPPEFEESLVQAVLPKKKVYKIIFIKVPTRETKTAAQLQGLANTVAPIEDKTIIYVLSKEPETQQVVLPKPVPSEHEVLFVKYSGNPSAVGSLNNGILEQSDSEFLLTPTLQPGAINGKR